MGPAAGLLFHWRAKIARATAEGDLPLRTLQWPHQGA
jgi:hypothetical protein